MENHALIPAHLRAVHPKIPTEFPPTPDMVLLEDAIRIAPSFASPAYLELLGKAKEDLLYYRKSVVDGTIAARPTYLEDFTRLHTEKITAFFLEVFSGEEFSDSEKRNALFYSLEMLEFLDVDLFYQQEKAQRFTFWKSYLETIGAGERVNNFEKYRNRMRKLENNFEQPHSV